MPTIFLSIVLLATAGNASPESQGTGWTVEAIRWQNVAPNGTSFALLECRRDKAGVAF